MNIVDDRLRQRDQEGNPIMVGLVGAGASARMIASHLMTPVPGIRLAGIANRTLAHIGRVRQDHSDATFIEVTTEEELQAAMTEGICATTDDANLLCEADQIDVIIDATGSVEYGAQLAIKAIEKGKHLVLVNSELDSTLGPILKVHADSAGVTVTNTDGDEPGVAMNLVRYLRSIGLKPVAAGNLKGMLDRYRTPETQRDFAARYSMNPKIVTSFADGTKLSMESAVLANATGFRVGTRGMYGFPCDHVNEIIDQLSIELLLEQGLIDYALGAAPHTGAFVVVHEENPIKRSHLDYFNMGPGPHYVFYTPYHLPHLQIAATIGRAVLLGDATVSPIADPVCSVAAAAKKDLKVGEVLDGIGGFATYGVIENAGMFNTEQLLPMGLAEGRRLVRSVRRDEPIRVGDVETPVEGFADRLHAEQISHFS